MMLIVAAVVVLGGAGGGYWWWSHKAGAEGAQVEEEEPKGDPGVISFEPFVANLADEGNTRFLRAAVKIVVDSAEHAKEIEENPVVLAQARSAILEALTQSTADELVTPEGKRALKEAITEKCAEILHETEITDVLFTEFVVQF